MSNHCSPLVIHTGSKKSIPVSKIKTLKTINKKSCLSLSVIKELVIAWNNKNLEDKIDLNQPAQSLYRDLKSKFNGDDEIMWFEHDIMTSLLDKTKIDEVRNKYFKPVAPDSWNSNPEQWLSNLDIEKVLNQYEEKYPSFKSYGALPIDFALKSGSRCIINDLCKISLNELMKNGIKYIGVIFNLDKHTESGSHWISLFINIPKGEINFWDSVAKIAPTEVEELMTKLYNQLNDIYNNNQSLYRKCECKFKEVKKQYNTIRHQYANSECGMYSLHFIIEQLEGGKTFNQICNNIINDAKMNAMRKEYFIIKDLDKKSTSLFGIF